MSINIIFVLMYHCQRLLDLIYGEFISFVCVQRKITQRNKSLFVPLVSTGDQRIQSVFRESKIRNKEMTIGLALFLCPDLKQRTVLAKHSRWNVFPFRFKLQITTELSLK
jgi:hypothetical protein